MEPALLLTPVAMGAMEPKAHLMHLHMVVQAQVVHLLRDIFLVVAVVQGITQEALAGRVVAVLALLLLVLVLLEEQIPVVAVAQEAQQAAPALSS